MKDAADLINALTGLAWPFIAALVIWRLLPTIKKIAESRGFTVKVGETELTVQEVSEKLVATTADIQRKLASVSTSPTPGEAGILSTDLLRRILWVDDKPSNNFYEVAQLQTLGVDVVQVKSTTDGMAAVLYAEPPFDAVISDMSRAEEGTFKPNAGLDLVRQIREHGNNVPVFIYSSHQTINRRGEILAASANGVTASPTALFQPLRTVGKFPQNDTSPA